MSVFRQKGIAFGALVALAAEMAALALLLALCAWLTGIEALPQEYMNGYIILCVFLSVFPVCATISGGRGRGHLPFCLLCAAEMVFVLLLTAAAVDGLEPYGAWTLRVFGGAFFGALAAAFVQIRHNGKRKQRRHRR